MTESRKRKISISLSSDLLDRVDRAAAREPGATRSSVIEGWLRTAARGAAEASLAAEVIAYYETRTAGERSEDERLSRGLSAAARRVRYDDSDAATPSRGAARVPEAAHGRTSRRKKRG